MAFVLIRLVPGDPVELMIGERGASPEVMAEMRANLGLDQPLVIQYFSFLKNALTFDLGTSIISKKPVVDEFLARFPATIELSFVGLFFAILIGIPLGIIAAVKRNSSFDYLFMGGALVGYSMPIFWWGLILILIFSVQLGFTPVSGRISVFYDIPPVTGFMLIDSLLSEDSWPAFWSALKHLILPSIALGTIPLAAIARMTRSSLLEVLREDYIRTAKAKGLTAYQVIAVHALRNALIPIVTVIGVMVGTLLTGAILTETIFSWPGIGRWLVASVTSRDYPVIQGGVWLISAIIILVNLLVDLVYMWINPHMRNLS
ncbi:MAG: ABC transporter permease subunit [Bdellovibrionales bacterium]|nr:ABC transporter permease subunit [Bdellovibrionales bacterium]